MPMEMPHERGTGVLDIARAYIDRCEDIKQVLDVYFIQCNPSCSFEVGLVWVKIDTYSCKVTFLGRAE